MDFKKNKTEKMSLYKGVGVCKGVLKSGLYIYIKKRQVFGGMGVKVFKKEGVVLYIYIFFTNDKKTLSIVIPIIINYQPYIIDIGQ